MTLGEMIMSMLVVAWVHMFEPVFGPEAGAHLPESSRSGEMLATGSNRSES